jgi:hypothetical protein
LIEGISSMALITTCGPLSSGAWQVTDICTVDSKTLATTRMNMESLVMGGHARESVRRLRAEAIEPLANSWGFVGARCEHDCSILLQSARAALPVNGVFFSTFGTDLQFWQKDRKAAESRLRQMQFA